MWNWWLIPTLRSISCWSHRLDNFFQLFIKWLTTVGQYWALKSTIFASAGLHTTTTARGPAAWWLLNHKTIAYQPYTSPSLPSARYYCLLSSLSSTRRSYPFKRLGSHGSTTQQKTSYSNDQRIVWMNNEILMYIMIIFSKIYGKIPGRHRRWTWLRSLPCWSHSSLHLR